MPAAAPQSSLIFIKVAIILVFMQLNNPAFANEGNSSTNPTVGGGAEVKEDGGGTDKKGEAGGKDEKRVGGQDGEGITCYVCSDNDREYNGTKGCLEELERNPTKLCSSRDGCIVWQKRIRNQLPVGDKGCFVGDDEKNCYKMAGILPPQNTCAIAEVSGATYRGLRRCLTGMTDAYDDYVPDVYPSHDFPVEDEWKPTLDNDPSDGPLISGIHPGGGEMKPKTRKHHSTRGRKMKDDTIYNMKLCWCSGDRCNSQNYTEENFFINNTAAALIARFGTITNYLSISSTILPLILILIL